MRYVCVIAAEAFTIAIHGPGDKTGQYSGLVDCFVKSFRTGGLATFYNGFLPNFARLGSWNCAMFLTVEQVLPAFPLLSITDCSASSSATTC